MADNIKKAGSIKKLLMALLVIGPASILVLISTLKCEHKFKKLDVFGTIPAYEAVTGENRKINNNTFKNEVVIYTTLQESCPKECGISLWFVDRHLFRHIRENRKKLGYVKIVSFVIDKDGNPVDDLSNMEQILRDNVIEYDPELWILAKGNAQEVFNIEHNGQNLVDANGEEFINGKAYNSLLLLADKKNQLRMVMRGDSEGTVRTLQQHLFLLLKEYDLEAYKASHPKK